MATAYNRSVMTPPDGATPDRHAPDVPPPPEEAATPEGRAAHWHPASRFVLLNVGLLLYGVSLAAMIRAHVGLSPWDALHVGLSHTFPILTVGYASILVGFACLTIAYLLLKMPVGIGSLLNMVLIGVYLDLFLPRLPAPVGPYIPWALFLAGILGVGLATGTYIASGFGAGPRDSLVIGLNRRTGWPVKYVRTGVELVVLLTGWLLGAKVGWGTLVFALTIGPAMSAGMGLFGLRR
jgi:uncharacterized protein